MEIGHKIKLDEADRGLITNCMMALQLLHLNIVKKQEE